MLNVQCALLQLYIYSHYGVINEQVMPPLPRHEYGRIGAVCRRMGNEKVNIDPIQRLFYIYHTNNQCLIDQQAVMWDICDI